MPHKDDSVLEARSAHLRHARGTIRCQHVLSNKDPLACRRADPETPSPRHAGSVAGYHLRVPGDRIFLDKMPHLEALIRDLPFDADSRKIDGTFVVPLHPSI